MQPLREIAACCRRYRCFFQTSLGTTALVLIASHLGWLQLFELKAFDLFFRLRPEREPHPEIVVVEIRESDISFLGQWPLSDQKLVELLSKIKAHQPQSIGLDLYRDFSIPPGSEEWKSFVQRTPELFGVEKIAGDRVAAPIFLKDVGQVALADVLPDIDSTVRRGLISVRTETEEYKVGLGARLAFEYLSAKGIEPQPSDSNPSVVKLGAATFEPLHGNFGLYRGIDSGGYQLFINYQGKRGSFTRISTEELMTGNFPDDALKNKIVLVGTTAPSLNDEFLTPYNTSFTKQSRLLPGVYIHASITRQLIEAATTGKGLFRDWPEGIEALWIFLWSTIGFYGSDAALRTVQRRNQPNGGVTLFCSVLGSSLLLFGSGYGLFRLDRWIPVVAPTLSLIAASITQLALQNKKLHVLASIDQLTTVANRRTFDRTLQESLEQDDLCCLILCDVDYFKPFNDMYGHLEGDRCLKLVAKAISRAVHRDHLVARYGGEEFSVILTNTSFEVAQEVAEQIRAQVMKLEIEHKGSKVYPHVTLSCGVTGFSKQMLGSSITPETLIKVADQALYSAKEEGRNRAVWKSI